MTARPWILVPAAMLLAAVVLPAALPGGPAAPVSPGTAVIIQLRETPAAGPSGRAARQALGTRAAALGAVSMEPMFVGHTDPADPLARFWIARGSADRTPEELVAGLAAEPWVASAALDVVTPLAGCPPSDHFLAHADSDSTQWPLYGNTAGPDLNALEAWNVTRGDTSVVIAVLDSGIYWEHPDFGPPLSPEGSIRVNRAEANGQPGVDDDGNGYVDDVRGWDFVDVSTIPGETGRVDPAEDGLVPDSDPVDYDGHGTFVSGIIGARADDAYGMAGVAPGCRILPVRVAWHEHYTDSETGRTYDGGVTANSFCAQGIVYAADNGARVINASWLSDETPVLKAAADYAIDSMKVVMVVAAGNTGLVDNQKYNYLSRRGDCIDVAALARTGVVSSATAIGRWVDISAPGENILSLAVPRDHRLFKIFRGGATSFATPFVSAAAGLAISAGSSSAEVRSTLMARATPIYDIGANWYYRDKLGAGLVNLAGTVEGAQDNLTWRGPVRLPEPAASAPAVLPDRMVFTDEANRFWSVYLWNSNSVTNVQADSVRLPMDGPVTGLAAVKSDEPEAPLGGGRYAVGFRSGHVALLGLPGWPRPVGGPLYAGPVLADLDGDADPDVVVAGSDSMLYAWKSDGMAVPGFPVRLGDGSVVSPAIGDLDGDGGVDIVTVTRNGVVEVIEGTGAARTGWPVGPVAGAGTISTLLADVEGDGRLELIVPGSDGRIHCLDRGGLPRAGSWPVALGATISGEPGAADLDGDGRAEILVALADGSVVVLNGGGQTRDGWPVELGAEPIGGPLAMVVDGGSLPAVMAATRSGCTHAFDREGQELPGWPKRQEEDLAQVPAGLTSWSGGDRLFWTTAADGTVRNFLFRGPTTEVRETPWSCLGGNAARTRCLPATVTPAVTARPAVEPRLRLSPNPWPGGAVQVWLSIEQAGPVRVDVFDIQGRLVRRVFEGFLPAGETPLAWDGLDARGRPVAAGLYACRAVTPGRLITGRLIRLR